MKMLWFSIDKTIKRNVAWYIKQTFELASGPPEHNSIEFILNQAPKTKQNPKRLLLELSNITFISHLNSTLLNWIWDKHCLIFHEHKNRQSSGVVDRY